MNKKLLSGIMSGLMLASSCSAVGAEAPKGIKDRIVNSVINHKKLVLASVAISAVADGAVIWLLTHNNNIKMDYSKFKDFENFFSNFKKAAKAFRKSVTVSNIKVSDAKEARGKLLGAISGKCDIMTISAELDNLDKETQGTLVVERVRRKDGRIEIKFDFKENKKAEEKEEEKKEKTDVNPENGTKKEENENQGTKVNEDKKENEGQVAKEDENKKEDDQDDTENNEDDSEKDGSEEDDAENSDAE